VWVKAKRATEHSAEAAVRGSNRHVTGKRDNPRVSQPFLTGGERNSPHANPPRKQKDCTHKGEQEKKKG